MEIIIKCEYSVQHKLKYVNYFSFEAILLDWYVGMMC